jgi:WD40 repeat protein
MKSVRNIALVCLTLLLVSSFVACADKSLSDRPSTGATVAPQPQLVVQTGHADSINQVAFSPDGKLIASARLVFTPECVDRIREVKLTKRAAIRLDQELEVRSPKEGY